MSETKDQEEKRNPDLQINKGVELMLRNKNQKRREPKTFQIRFGKMVSLLKREIHIFLEFSFDIRKQNSNQE
jgi:hypothetical protein